MKTELGEYLNSDDDRQDISTMATPPINSKLDARQPIPKTRQHDRKKIWKKLKVMMTDMTTKKGRQKVSLSHINMKKQNERGDAFSDLIELQLQDFFSFEN